jgi:hypothetical protein
MIKRSDSTSFLPSRPPQKEKAPPRNSRPQLRELKADLPTILSQSPVPWESLFFSQSFKNRSKGRLKSSLKAKAIFFEIGNFPRSIFEIT